jgi:hypothetical protein
MGKRRQATLPMAAARAHPAAPAAVYADYLETLMVRPHHGDRAFPLAAATTLVGALCGAECPRQAAAELGAALGAAARDAVRGGAWWTDRALAMAAGALVAVPRLEREAREATVWAALLLPMGALLGPRLQRVLGGAELWQGAAGALKAAAFAGRLDGVPARARSLLVRLGGVGSRGDTRALRLGRAAVALAAAAAANGLASELGAQWREGLDPLAARLAVRYRGRMEGAGRL